MAKSEYRYYAGDDVYHEVEYVSYREHMQRFPGVKALVAPGGGVCVLGFKRVEGKGVTVPLDRWVDYRVDKPSLHKCDARCMNAKGHNCECSCGGKNHGLHR